MAVTSSYLDSTSATPSVMSSTEYGPRLASRVHPSMQGSMILKSSHLLLKSQPIKLHAGWAFGDWPPGLLTKAALRSMRPS